MRLRNEVARLYELAGKPVVIKITNMGLSILTDTEAIKYLANANDKAVARIRRDSKRLMGNVDRTKLTETERNEHQATISLNAWRVFHLKKAAKDARQKQIGMDYQDKLEQKK